MRKLYCYVTFSVTVGMAIAGTEKRKIQLGWKILLFRMEIALPLFKVRVQLLSERRH
jgi:hypothetical protein